MIFEGESVLRELRPGARKGITMPSHGRPRTRRQVPQGRWVGVQMETDDGAPEADRPELAAPGGPGAVVSSGNPPDWNSGQMAITHGEPQPHMDPDTMADSEAGPTGLRANPGGGERWGSIDPPK